MKLKGIELNGTYEVTYFSTSFGIYNERDKVIYYEDSYGYWFKSEYDEEGNKIYFEDSNGKIIDKRVKELTIGQIEKILGYKIKIKGERK